MQIPTSKLREKLLKERGLTPTQPKARQHRKLVLKVQPGRPDLHKTPLMQMLEMKYGGSQNIWEILQSGSLSTIRKRLGNEVDISTISKWMKKYKLRYTESNLPDCRGCQHHKPWCDLGSCNILMEMELWDLIGLKKEELHGTTKS